MALEDTLVSWSQGPTDTEKMKAANAERLIRDAINEYPALAGMNVRVFAQGSYKANTNVRHSSDVDVCVLHEGVCFVDMPDSLTDARVGLSDGGLTYPQFKNLIGGALERKFGHSGVTRGNKAYDVHETGFHLDADVVPAFEHRRYVVSPGSQGFQYEKGIEFRPDSGGRIINWPQQTYDNGVRKNDGTARKYKRVIRVLKRLRDKMQEENLAAANDVASFLIESLVWNTPDGNLTRPSYSDNLKATLTHLWDKTQADQGCSEWGEVNELKYLFRDGQPWTRAQANAFILAAWNRLFA